MWVLQGLLFFQGFPDLKKQVASSEWVASRINSGVASFQSLDFILDGVTWRGTKRSAVSIQQRQSQPQAIIARDVEVLLLGNLW